MYTGIRTNKPATHKHARTREMQTVPARGRGKRATKTPWSHMESGDVALQHPGWAEAVHKVREGSEVLRVRTAHHDASHHHRIRKYALSNRSNNTNETKSPNLRRLCLARAPSATFQINANVHGACVRWWRGRSSGSPVSRCWRSWWVGWSRRWRCQRWGH